MRHPSFRAACLGVASLIASACASTPAISNTNNIVRATDVELVCLELAPTGIIPRPTARCVLSDTDNGPGANSTLHLHAVVPQFDRGELAVVDLATTSGVALVDNSPATPGYSFLPVGEFPVSITADIGDSITGANTGYLYVASGRSDRVLRVDAAALRGDPRRADFTARRQEIPVGGIPRDLVIVRAGTRRLLVATLPEARAVSFVDVTDAAAPGAPQVITLQGGAVVGDAGAAVPAHPVSLAVDDAAGRVYVTDDALDRVHAIDVASRAEVEPLAVGARTRVAVVTGIARQRAHACDVATDPDHCARTRYLYLTTADEGAVIVWDLTRGARVRPNLLPLPNARESRINPGLAVDRVALSAPATALVAINTATYDDTATQVPDSSDPTVPASCTSGYQSPGQGVYAGVYVGVVLRTGQLAVIDVDDYNVDNWEAQCRAAAGGRDTGAYRFVRHAPHAANTINTDRPFAQAPALKDAPAVTALIGTVPGQALEATRAPAFACADTRMLDGTSMCTATNNYGVELPRREVSGGTGGVDVPADPYTSRNDAWAFVYEGVIPGLEQSGGALAMDASGALRLDAPGGFFCTRGALANDRARDWLTLVSDPTPLAADRDGCAMTFGSGTTPTNRDFVIDRAFEDHLVLRASGGVVDGAAVLRCFPQAVQFAVRAGQQWIAVGLSTGFAHSVRVGAGRECEIDPVKEAEVEGYARQCLLTRTRPATDVDAQLARRCPVGRACTGTLVPGESALRRELAPLFANPFLCTQIFPALTTLPMENTVAALAVDRGTQIAFTLANAYEPVFTPAGSLPVAVRHLRGVDRLYVVDSALNGLMEFRFNPFAQGRIFN